MLKNFLITALLSLVFIGHSFAALAEQSPEKLILEVSQEVLDAVKKERHTFKRNPQPLKNTLLSLLDPVTDFESFAKGVMGEYRTKATPEQLSQFMTDFKQTLVDLYTKALVAFEVKEMVIHETKINTPQNANVVMKVTSPEGAIYFVQYSMRKNGKGEWQVRNVVLDGVNLGLTYRNQFKSAMNTENQDIAKVINGWAVAMRSQEDLLAEQ